MHVAVRRADAKMLKHLLFAAGDPNARSVSSRVTWTVRIMDRQGKLYLGEWLDAAPHGGAAATQGHRGESVARGGQPTAAECAVAFVG